MSTFTVETTVHPDHTVIALVGEVDRAAALALSELAMKCLSETSTRLVVIDMARVTLMNSIALRALVELRSAATGLDKELLLSHLPNRVALIDSVNHYLC